MFIRKIAIRVFPKIVLPYVLVSMLWFLFFIFTISLQYVKLECAVSFYEEIGWTV